MLLMEKLNIAIVGPGVVGKATGKAFIEKGFNVSFFGVDPKNIEELKKQKYKAYFTKDLQNGIHNFPIIFLTVPTPTTDGKIDFQPMKDAAKDLGKRMANSPNYHLVVVKSTVLPGTTEHLIIPLIEHFSGKKAGIDFGVCMNPEFLREKTAEQDARDPWVTVIGEYDHRSGDILEHLYQDFGCPVYRVSLKEAEMQKYIHNLFNAVKISFFNEMRDIGNEIGVNTEKVFRAVALSCEGIWNPRYGLRDKGPFAGACLPKDTQAFLHWAENQGLPADILKTTIKFNKQKIKQEVKLNGKKLEDFASAPP